MSAGNEPIRFVYAPMSMLLLMLAGVGLTAVSAAIAFRILPDEQFGFGVIVGYCGLLFFGAATVLIVWRLVTTRGAVVIVTDSGFTDLRLAPEEIPWSAIDRIGAVQMNRQKIMVLAVDPAAEARLHLTRTVRWSRRANAALGVTGLATTAQGLNVDFDTLFDICRTRRQGKSSPSSY